MAFPFRNPTAASSLTAPEAVGLTTVQGTNFSVLQVGGFMEVYYLSDLSLTFAGTGAQTNSANTIPIQISLGAGTPLSPAATLTLNSDNVSSGRRRLGMLVYVNETDTTYQYTVPNYDTLFNAVSANTGTSGFTFGTNSTTVQTRTPAGINFINAWTGTTVEGQNGVSRNDARWRIFYTGKSQLTGGTFDTQTQTLNLLNVTGGTVSISGFTAPITGGTINYETSDLTLEGSDGGVVTISGFNAITGGTYNSGTTTLTLYDNLGSTINVTGFTSGGGNISLSANTGLGSDTDVYYTIYNTLVDDSVTNVEVGGATSGTTAATWKTKTFVQVLDEILFPDVNPTYTIPTIVSTGINDLNIEVGSVVSATIGATAIKNDAGNFNQLRVLRNNTAIFTDTSLSAITETNVADQFGYVNPNSPNSGFTLSPSPYTDAYTIPAPTGVTTSTQTVYKVDGNYSSGQAKKNNKNVTDSRTPLVRQTDAPQLSADTFTSSSSTLTGIYPYFYGKSASQPSTSDVATAIQSGSATKVLSDASGTISATFAASGEYIWFAHFANYTNKTTWYVSDLNQGNIGGGSNLFATPQQQNVSSPDTYWSTISFDIYISNYSTSTSGAMQFRN